MRKELLFLWFALFSFLGAVAQTDVTSQYLVNADFEGDATIIETTSGNGNIYQPTGWTVVYSNGDQWDSTVLNDSDGKWNNFSSRPQLSNGDKNTYWTRFRWGNSTSITLTQSSSSLPAGNYRLSADVYWNGSNSTAYMSFAGQTVNMNRNTWARYSIVFTLTEAAAQELQFSLTQNSAVETWIGIDNIKLEKFNGIVATKDLSLDWTGMMANPGFEEGALTNNSNTINTPYGFTMAFNMSGWLDGSINTTNPSEGSRLYNLWSGTVTSTDMYQMVTLPMGKYTITADLRVDLAEYINDQGVYATVDGTTYKSGTIKTVAGIWNSTEGWNTLSKDFYVPSNNSSVRIGASSSNSDGTFTGRPWYQIDNFTLTYHGAVGLLASDITFGTNTSVTAGTWYVVPLSAPGEYTISSTAATMLYYTQAGKDSPSDVTTALAISANGNKKFTVDAACTLYFRSTAASTLKFYTESYSYVVSSAAVDRTYVQGGETITVSYPNAATNDPNATLTISTSGIKFNGSNISATPTLNGFTFTIPTVTAGANYTLTLPAGVAKYGSNASSEAQTITLHTPAVFDGTYYICNESGKYLSRGSSWGTRAIVDDWGLPIELATDGQGVSTLKFLDSGVYLYATDASVWCDSSNPSDASAQWNVSLNNGKYRLSNSAQPTTYLKLDSGNADLYADGSDAAQIQQWTFEQPSAHPAKLASLRTAATALSSEVSGLSSKTEMESNPTATAEEYQGDSYAAWKPIFSGTFTAYPGIYKFTIPAFHRMSTNPVTWPMHQTGTESVPVYAYFGDAKVQLHSVYDNTTNSGNGTYTPDNTRYYPNTQATALAAFQAGSYKNEVWLRVTEPTTIEYGIANQGGLRMEGRWTCYSESGIEIVRYYDASTEALSDGDDLTSLIFNATIESNNEGSVPSGWTGTTSSWRWTVGTGDTYMECWNGAAHEVNFDMHQTISGLQEGVYELSADMFNSSNDEALAAQFTGGECGLYATTPSAHAFVGVTTDGTDLTKHTLYIYVKEGESLTLGVKNMATPTARWFGCDNFTLKYRTLDTASPELIASVPTSKANSSLKNAMSSASLNLSSASTKTGDLFNALTSAIADVRVSAANYGHLLYALSNEDSRLASAPAAVQTEYASLVSGYRLYYDNQTASGDCEAEMHLVKAALAQALINQNESLTYLIVNNSFETGDLTGWNISQSGDDTGVKTNGGATYGTDGGDGTYLFNTWASGDKGGYPLRQNIGYLPAGTYKLTSLVTTGAGTVFLLINDFVSSGTASNDKTTFLTSAITFTLDELSEVTIGVAGGDGDAYTGNSYCWYKADNFQLATVEEQGGGEEEEDDVMISSTGYYARGSQDIFGRFAVKGSSSAITQQGLCYSTTNKEPTIGDQFSTDYISYCGKIYKISGLTPATAYYVRPYARINGNLYYGEVHKVYTLPAGSITYSIRTSDNATYDTNITNAISTWAEYWNKYTCISGYHSNAGFVDGVPTADCYYGGWIRFGSNTSYQQCGTAMHENLHGIGMGTTTEWTNLGSGKTWAGPRVNEFIKFFENSDGATMYGDSQHAWCSNSNGGLSYTINGAHEDAYSDLQRTANSLLAQAYTEDGLRPNSNAYYYTPYYSIEQEDDDVFYIQNSSNGKYLVDNNGTLGIVAYSSLDDAKFAGIAAWTLTFDPVTRWYHLTSVKYGNKLSHQNYVWGINKEDKNLNIVKSVNAGKYYINTPTTNGRNLLGDLSCGTTASVDTSNANGQDWVFYREQPEEEVLYGDITKDGSITLADLTALINILNGDSSNPSYNYKAANVNADAGITAADIKAMLNLLFGK